LELEKKKNTHKMCDTEATF